MGLPSGWITDPIHQLTANQQIAALGNGVLPLQALSAMRVGALVQADAASLAGVQHPAVSRGCKVSQEEEGEDEKAGESALDDQRVDRLRQHDGGGEPVPELKFGGHESGFVRG